MRQWVRRARRKESCFSQRVLNMKALLNWTGRCVNQRRGSGLYGCMSSLMQGGEKLPFLQAAVRIMEVTCLRLIQPFQCSGLETGFELSPENAYRNVILDLQASELPPAQPGAAPGLVRPYPSLPAKGRWHFMELSGLGGICPLRCGR